MNRKDEEPSGMESLGGPEKSSRIAMIAARHRKLKQDEIELPVQQMEISSNADETQIVRAIDALENIGRDLAAALAIPALIMRSGPIIDINELSNTAAAIGRRTAAALSGDGKVGKKRGPKKGTKRKKRKSKEAA